MESAFGLRISYSLGRWVLIHVLGIVLVTAMVLASLAAWNATARLFFLDKLYVLQIDLGDEQRQIVAGIRKDYTAGALRG